MTSSGEGPRDRQLPEVIDQAQLRSFRDAVRDQWIQARRDLSSLYTNFSAGGIALLVTLLSTTGLPSVWVMPLYLGAFGAFVRAIHLRTKSLEWDSGYLKAAWDDPDAVSEETVREGERLDRKLGRSFWWGVFLAVLIAFLSALAPFISTPGTLQGTSQQQEVHDDGGIEERTTPSDTAEGDPAGIVR